MTPAQLDEITARAASAFTYADFHQVAGQDVPALIGEIRRLESLYAGAVAANRLEQDAVRAVAAERDAALEANRIMREAATRRRAETLRLTHTPGACPTLCDDDCDAACHEEHEVPAKRVHQPPPGTAEFRWGESVSWTAPGKVTIPLTYGAHWTADLVLRGVAETRVLADMLADALNVDADTQTGCCAKDGIDCVSCMTGRCAECSECVHYDDSARDDEDDYAEGE